MCTADDRLSPACSAIPEPVSAERIVQITGPQGLPLLPEEGARWEAAGRAREVLLYLEGRGIPAKRLGLAGYAEQRPKVANSSADWDPLDPRDPVTQVFAPGPGSAAVVSHTLEEQSIAVQKSVEAINPATGEADASIVPGKTLLRYTVNFQVSDYYAFENVILRDVMSDGQRLFIGTRDAVDAFPTMSVNNAFVTGSPAGSRVNTSGTFEGAGVIDYQRRYSTDHPLANPTSFPVDGPATGTIRPNVFTNLTPAPDTNVDDGGRTFLQFNISDELKARLGANAGRLVGGEISNSGTGPQNNPFGSQLFSGTTGTIVFYAEVCEEFSDAHPSNDTSVDLKADA
jgi:hypothetical protein